MTTTLNPIKDAEIGGVGMTARQAETARAFARHGYIVSGFCTGAIVLRRRTGRGDRVWIEVDELGRVIPPL